MHTVLALLTEATQQPTTTTATSSGSGGGDVLPFDVTQILQFGLLGLIFLAILFRKYLVPEWVLRDTETRHQQEKDELVERLNETREQLDKLQDVFQDQMIPALTRATEINARYNEELTAARFARGSRSSRPSNDPDEEDEMSTHATRRTRSD